MELKDILPFLDPETLKRWTEYQQTRDWNLVDWTQPKTFTDLANVVRNSGLGGDVREALAKMFEEVSVMVGAGANEEQARQILELIGKSIKKGQVTMADLTQEVKEVLNGDRPLPIVGKDSVIGYENIVEGTVTPMETNFITSKNLFNGVYQKGVAITYSSNIHVYTTKFPDALGVILKVEPSTSYTLFKSADTDRFGVATFEGEPSHGQSVKRLINPYEQQYANESPISFTTTETENTLVIYVSSASERRKPSLLHVQKGIVTKMDQSLSVKNLKLDWSDFNLMSKGKNLWDGEYLTDYALLEGENNTVSLRNTTIAKGAKTVIFKVPEPGTYTLSQIGADRFRVGMHNSELQIGVPLDETIHNGFETPKSITVDASQAKYIVVQLASSATEMENIKFQIEKGSVSTRIESPYAVNLELSEDTLSKITPISGGGAQSPFKVDLYEPSNDFQPPKLVADNSTMLYAKYDELMAEFPNYIKSKVSLGTESSGLHIYRYDLKPHNVVQKSFAAIEMPKVLLLGGTHGHEKEAQAGLYRFIHDLCYNWDKNKTLEYIRFNLHIVLIPQVSPYGVQHNQRLNANGVDINRNFLNDWKFGGEGTDYYSGTQPMTEPEVLIIDELLKSERNVTLAIDYHNQGSFAVDKSIAYFASQDNDLIPKFYPLANQMDGYYRKTYPTLLNHDRSLIGLYGRRPSFDGALFKHFDHYGIPGVLVESTGAFQTTKEDVNSVNAHVIGNILVGVLNYLY